MLGMVPAKITDPLFLIPDRLNKALQPLTYRIVMKYLKEWVEQVTGETKGWSMHSLRRGGTTWCFNVDITTEVIRMMGTWASDAYKRYLNLDLNKWKKNMKKFVSSIDKLVAELNS